MVIKMLETRIMPFGVFAEGQEYDTEKHTELTTGQAKTFCLCGAAVDVATPHPSGVKRTRKKVTDDVE